MKDEYFFDLNLELSILSSIIFEPSSFVDINPNSFYNPLLKNIYLTIVALKKQGSPIDEVLIRNHLINTVNIKKEVVEDTLLNIISTNPVSNLSTYIERLEEFRRKRDVKTALLSLNKSLNDNKTADELESFLLQYTEKITRQSATGLFDMIPASFVEEKEADFISKDFIPIPKNTVTIFSAGGGTGKTSLLLQLAMHYLNECPTSKAFCWLSEDPLGLTKHRLNTIINGLYSAGRDTLHRLILSDSLTFSTLIEEKRNIVVNSAFYKMKLMLKDFDLIVFDPLIAFFGGDENNNAQAKMFMQLFTKWAGEEEKTIIFIHHSTKNTSQSRGASAFVDAARAVYEIEKIKDDEEKEVDSSNRMITLTKDNYRASKHFGGFKKKIQVFPKESRAVVVKYEYKEESFFAGDTLSSAEEIDNELGII